MMYLFQIFHSKRFLNMSSNFPLKRLHKALIWSLLMLPCALANAQTTLISPTGDGGFELGSTVGANGWTVANASPDSWVVGNLATTVSAGSRGAYVSADAGATWGYSQLSTILHLYKNVTIPTGETKLTLSFKWKAGGEGTTTSDWDNLKVFLVPTSVAVPIQGTAQNASYLWAGAQSVSGMYKLSSASFNAETLTMNVPAGSYRLVFSWKSDVSTIAQPPAAIDEISLVSSVPPNINVSSTAMGGLWSSPSTWVGGAVPVGDDVTISAGSTVVMDVRVSSIRDLTIAGLLQCGTVANPINVRDVLIQNTGTWNPFHTPTTPGTTLTGQSINLSGNFTNNGTANLATTSTLLSFIGSTVAGGRMTQTMDGTGTFIGNGSAGLIRSLFCQTTGNVILNTAQNIVVTNAFANTAGNFNSNGKLTLDNTAQVFGTSYSQQVSQIAITGMGAGYTSAPTVTLSAPTGAGTTATAVANYDAATGTVRSITITNPGSGYRISPTVTLTGGGFTTIATASAIVHHVISGATSLTASKTGSATFTGGLNIVSNQSVGSVSVTNTSTNNVGYTVAPEVGFSLPTNYLNLVTNGGSGYTTAPTVTVSGGTRLTGGTDPTFTVVVAQGKVVSVNCSGGGTLWTVPPTLAISGNATAAFPANCLATATASIDNGMVNNFTITNGGFGYSAAPTVGLVSAAGTFTTASAIPSARIGTYTLTLGWFAPAPALAQHQDDATIPANRRISNLTMSSGGLLLNNNIELYASAPLTLTSGVIDLGNNNTLTCSSPVYAGTAGSATTSVNGNIVLNTWGGSVTRTFPYDATVAVATGTGSLATGSTVTKLTASRVALPTGNGAPAGVVTGIRSYKITANTGIGSATYGTDPTVTLNYNTTDGIAADNATLYVGHAAANTGVWTSRSVAGAAGALPVTGSRTSQITGVGTGPIVPTGLDYYAWVTTFDFNSSTATGNWNNAAIWSKGTVPVCTDAVYIQPNHTVTVNSTGNVSKNLTINPLATLTVASGDLKVGCTAYNNPLTVKGTLNVNGGDLNVNGNLETILNSTFTQSGGNINVDGNDAGAVATSVANTVPLVKIVPTNISSVNLTGGTLTIVDPHASATATNALQFNGSTALNYNVTNGHTLRLGNGVSTDAGGSTSGFQLNTWFSTAGLSLGNLTIASPTGVNRTVTSVNPLSIWGNLTLDNGGDMNTNSVLLNGNLNVNTGGTLTLSSLLLTNSTFTPTGITLTTSTNAQTISNTGTIRNAVATPAVNLNFLTVNNSHVTGATLSAPLSTWALNLAFGKLNTTTTNLLTIGSSNLEGTISGGSSTSFVNGPLARTYAVRAAGAAYDSTALFPIGKGSAYMPVHLTPTTTTAGLQLRAEAFATNPSTFNNPLINLADKRWEVAAIANSGFMTATGIRITEAGIVSTKEIVQASSGLGAYGSISVASTNVGTTLTTAATIASGSFTGFLSYGERCVTPALPTAAATQVTCAGQTVANLTATATSGATIVWYSAAAGGSPLASNTALTTGNYYVAQTIGGGCESARSTIAVTVNAVPTATITPSGATPVCQNQGYTLSANTGAGLTYQWQNNGANIVGETGATHIPSVSGAYTVVITNASGCSTTSSATNATINAAPTATITSSVNAICQGQSVLMNANTGTGLTYQWKKDGSNLSGETNATYTASVGGSYTVVVTSTNGCSTTSSAKSLSVGALPTATATAAGVTTFCQGGNVALNANTGAGLNYQWKNNGSNLSGETNASYTAIATGSYTVEVTNASGCANTSTAIPVTVNASPTATITNGATAGFCTGGNVTLTATNVAGATYQWRISGSTVGTGLTYVANAANPYTVLVTGTNGCTATSPVTTVSVNALPTATITTANTAFCGTSGTLTATTVGGATYQWQNNGSNISGANASTYLVTAASAYRVSVTITGTGCSAVSPAISPTITPYPTSVITNGATATFCGSGVLNIAPVSAAYQWKLNGADIPGATSATYTATTAGNYTAAVTAVPGSCSIITGATAVTINPLPTATSTPAGVTTFCQGGSVVLNANTGAGLTHQWNNNGLPISGATNSSYTANATGSYTVSVKDANTCVGTSAANAVTVNAFPAATITPASASTFCQGGSVVLNANTGTGLAYQWKESGNDILNATNASYTTNTAGSYTVVVTNISSCATTSSVRSVIVNALPTATNTVTGVTTFCQGGNVALNANTGTGLTYQWRNNGTNVSGATNANYSATATGSYTVVVMDANSCATTSNANSVTVNPLPTATSTATGVTTFCDGGNVILNANAGAGLTYQWNNNGSAIANATSTNYTANTTGSYTVVVTDANACVNTSTANVVTVNPLPTATSTAAGVTTFCQGGSVLLNANTGAGLMYQWKKNGTPIPNATTANYTANTSGGYTVVVTDANSCVSTSTANAVTVNPLPNTNITSATATTFCQGGNVVLNVPATPNTVYVWQRNGIIIPNASNANYVATTSGNYAVSITDANSCSAASSATTVTVVVNPSPAITVNGNTNFCDGDSVQLTASGGATYLWSTASTNPSIWVRAGGLYSVVVSNGICSATTAQQVSPRALPTASVSAIGPLTFCRGQNVTFNANTGAGLSYQWQRNGISVLGSTSSTFVADTTGNYQVIVRGSNGCTASSSAMAVTSNPNPTARLTPSTPIAFCQGDSARMSISGGATYLWSNNRTDTAFWVKTGGAYAVTVTDANGCTAYAANTVTVNALPMATITAGGVTSVCPDDVVSLNAPVGTGYMYQWRRNGNAIGTNRVFNATTAGAYTVNVTDANGCKANSDTTRVTIYSRPNVSFSNTIQSGTGSVVNFTNTSSAGTVRWYFGDALNSTSTQANPTFWYKSNGTYSVRLVVTNANGCSDSTAASVLITGVRTGVNDLVEPLKIKVYPNPFAESVQIEIENATVQFGNNDKIMVTNAVGQTVHQAVLNQKVMSLDTQDWSEGIYQVMIYTNGQMIPVKKVVKVIR
jgi:hypothetical protein